MADIVAHGTFGCAGAVMPYVIHRDCDSAHLRVKVVVPNTIELAGCWSRSPEGNYMFGELRGSADDVIAACAALGLDDVCKEVLRVR